MSVIQAVPRHSQSCHALKQVERAGDDFDFCGMGLLKRATREAA